MTLVGFQTQALSSPHTAENELWKKPSHHVRTSRSPVTKGSGTDGGAWWKGLGRRVQAQEAPRSPRRVLKFMGVTDFPGGAQGLAWVPYVDSATVWLGQNVLDDPGDGLLGSHHGLDILGKSLGLWVTPATGQCCSCRWGLDEMCVARAVCPQQGPPARPGGTAFTVGPEWALLASLPHVLSV